MILITKFKIQFEYGNFTLLICVELLGCMTQSCSDKNVEWDTLKAFFQDTRMSLALRVHHKDYHTYLLCWNSISLKVIEFTEKVWNIIILCLEDKKITHQNSLWGKSKIIQTWILYYYPLIPNLLSLACIPCILQNHQLEYFITFLISWYFLWRPEISALSDSASWVLAWWSKSNFSQIKTIVQLFHH